MQLTKHIGCLLALVFATASALAADWFTGTLGETLGAGEHGAWVTDPEISGWSWDAVDSVGTYKNFDNPLTFEASEKKVLSSADSTIVTVVKFTAMDAADFTGEVPTDAKAGLTVVEGENGVLSYKGLVGGQDGKMWATLSGQPKTEEMVTVKVQLFKDINDATFVRYIVDEVALKYNDVSDIAIDSGTAIQYVEYKGMCDIKSLSALAWDNSSEAKEKIAFDSGAGMPTEINVNRVELRARGVDVDNVDAIKTYLSTKQANGLKGWVNSALAIGDSENVSNLVSNVSAENAVKVNFGFEKDEESTLGYKVDGETTTAPSIALTSENNTGIHTVEVSVTKGGVTEEVATIDVGVMETGKTNKPETGTTYDIISVPWDGYGTQNPTVDSLLNTAELTAGDKLYVKKTSGGYDEYTLNEKGGAWSKAAAENALQSRSNQGAGDEDEGLEPGSAVWIEHSVNSRLILAGEAGDPSVAPQMPAAANDWTLMANPSIKPLAISTIDGNDGDQIVIEDAADPRQYERKNGAWGKYEKETTEVEIPGTKIKIPSTKLTFVPVVGTDVIGAGIGFWYVNTGAKAVTITFPNNLSE